MAISEVDPTADCSLKKKMHTSSPVSNSHRSPRLAAQSATSSSLSQAYVTDLERQQAENYSGHMVGRRYYLRPQPGEDTYSGGPGFALGSLHYNAGPRVPRRSRSTLTPMSMPRQPTEDDALSTLSQLPTQTEMTAASIGFNHSEYLLFFQGQLLRLWEMLSSFGASVFKSVTSLNGSSLRPIAYLSIIPKIRYVGLLSCYLLLFVCTGTVILFFGMFTTHLVKGTLPHGSSFVLLDSAAHDSLKSKYDTLLNRLPLSETKWNTVKAQLASNNLNINSLMDEIVRLSHSSQSDQLQEIQDKMIDLRAELQVLGQGDVWASARFVASKEARNLIKQHSTLGFLAVDPRTGSFRQYDQSNFQLSSDALISLTSVARNINHIYVKLFVEWWEDEQNMNWSEFHLSLKSRVRSIIEEAVATLLRDAQINTDKQPEFVMFIHHCLMQNSLLAERPVLSKILGDQFAVLAVESLSGLLQIPVSQIRLPRIDAKHISGLSTPLNYLLFKSYYMRQINFADEMMGTYIVRPDTTSYTQPISKTKDTHSEMDASHALRKGMESGKCWAFAPEGGKLSFRLPTEITSKKLVLYHPVSVQELPPSSIQLLAYVPDNGWSTVVEANLNWVSSLDSSNFSATLDITQSNILASHFRLMAYLSKENGNLSDFGCLYRIELQGVLPASSNSFVGFF